MHHALVGDSSEAGGEGDDLEGGIREGQVLSQGRRQKGLRGVLARLLQVGQQRVDADDEAGQGGERAGELPVPGADIQQLLSGDAADIDEMPGLAAFGITADGNACSSSL
jgi:hypothetical protein